MAPLAHVYGLTCRPSLRDRLRAMTAESTIALARLGIVVHTCHFIGPRLTCALCGRDACGTDGTPYADESS